MFPDATALHGALTLMLSGAALCAVVLAERCMRRQESDHDRELRDAESRHDRDRDRLSARLEALLSPPTPAEAVDSCAFAVRPVLSHAERGLLNRLHAFAAAHPACADVAVKVPLTELLAVRPRDAARPGARAAAAAARRTLSAQVVDFALLDSEDRPVCALIDAAGTGAGEEGAEAVEAAFARAGTPAFVVAPDEGFDAIEERLFSILGAGLPRRAASAAILSFPAR
jgi:hypothetical protein